MDHAGSVALRVALEHMKCSFHDAKVMSSNLRQAELGCEALSAKSDKTKCDLDQQYLVESTQLMIQSTLQI